MNLTYNKPFKVKSPPFPKRALFLRVSPIAALGIFFSFFIYFNTSIIKMYSIYFVFYLLITDFIALIFTVNKCLIFLLLNDIVKTLLYSFNKTNYRIL